MSAIFVFGSNLAGKHGRGSAREAFLYHGAIYGRGIGFHGQSYAIPTKDYDMRPLKLQDINLFVQMFINFARDNQTLSFGIVDIGCGLAGYQVSDIAPMFIRAPANCHFLEEFKTYLGR